MFKKIFLGFLVILVLAIGGLAVAISMQPADYRVERKVTVAAPASEVFPHVNNFEKFNAWNPWASLDPNAVYDFKGPKEGKDAVITWSGNSDVGKGQMTILESKPNELVKIKLDFLEPMQDTSTTEMVLKGDGNQTEVAWIMYGKNETFLKKGFCMVMNMDKMVGDMYEKGLTNLKTIVESPTKK